MALSMLLTLGCRPHYDPDVDSIQVRTQLLAVERSQEWLAHRLGINASLLSRYLRGLRRPPSDLADRIAQVMELENRARRAATEARARVLAS